MTWEAYLVHQTLNNPNHIWNHIHMIQSDHYNLSLQTEMQQIIMGMTKFKIILLALLCMYCCSFPGAPAKVSPAHPKCNEFSNEFSIFFSNEFCTHSATTSNSSADYPPWPWGLWLSHGQARKTAQQNVNQYSISTLIMDSNCLLVAVAIRHKIYTSSCTCGCDYRYCQSLTKAPVRQCLLTVYHMYLYVLSLIFSALIFLSIA